MYKLSVRILRKDKYIPIIQVVVATNNYSEKWITVQAILRIMKKAQKQFEGEILTIEKYPRLECDEKVAAGCTLKFKTERNLQKFSVCIQESDV